MGSHCLAEAMAGINYAEHTLTTRNGLLDERVHEGILAQSRGVNKNHTRLQKGRGVVDIHVGDLRVARLLAVNIVENVIQLVGGDAVLQGDLLCSHPRVNNHPLFLSKFEVTGGRGAGGDPGGKQVLAADQIQEQTLQVTGGRK